MATPMSRTRRVPRTDELPGYIHHPDFDRPNAVRRYGPLDEFANTDEYELRYMPDEVTRDHARRMHYAVHRMHMAATKAERNRWKSAYLSLRDSIVLGNRKLIYRAVRRRTAVQNWADDMIGNCHIVLIQAVAAFNPWLNIRFSTYAYTCLVRAIARSSRRLAADRLSQAMSFDALPDGEPGDQMETETPQSTGSYRLDEFLRAEHPLLTDREKAIISRRFSFDETISEQTLEEVGRGVGLSKERVRQVQASALGKLREALCAGSR